MAKTRKSTDTPAAARPAGVPLPIYVLAGADDGLRSRGLQSLLLQIATDEASVTEFSGGDAELAEVLDELRTLPMFATHRIVVVRDADKFITQHRDSIEDYLATPSPTGSLVLESRRWASNTRLAKLAEKIGQTTKCEPPTGPAFAGWLAQHAASLGKKLEPAATQLLRDLLGKDEPAIYLAEIEKLATYAADRPAITVQDVQALVSPMRSELVFAVTDAMADRNVGRALGLWEQVLASDKEAQFKAVGGLAWGLRKLMRARRLMDRGMSADQAARQAQIWGPNASAQVHAFSTRQLEWQLMQLARIDVSAKSGGDIRTEVQNFIVAACRGR